MTATNTEKTLIVLATISSFLLLVVQGLLNHQRSRLYDLILYFIVWISVLMAAGVLTAALLLFVLNTGIRVSIDAYSATLIGLAPIAALLTQVQLRRPYLIYKSFSFPALQGQLVYLRRYSPLQFLDDPSPDIFVREQDGHIRPSDSGKLCGKDLTKWNGEFRGHNANVARIRDRSNTGDSYRWWTATRTTALLCEPRLVGLAAWRDVRNALATISDLVVFGDLLFEKYELQLKKAYDINKGIRMSFGSSCGTVCNMLVKELGLAEWQLLELDSKPAGSLSVPRFPAKTDARGVKYRMILNILAEKSSQFQLRDAELFGTSMVHDLEESGYDSFCLLMEKWLRGHNFKIADFNDSNENDRHVLVDVESSAAN